jgi:hypothetical protein
LIRPRGQIGVDRHLLAGNGVERETRANLGDAGRALGYDDEIHDDEDEEDDQADDEIAGHDEVREASDDMAGGVHAFVAVGQDHARRRDVQRQSQHGRDQQDGREGREIERALNPQRHHEDQHRNRDGDGQTDIDHEGRYRQEQDGKDE